MQAWSLRSRTQSDEHRLVDTSYAIVLIDDNQSVDSEVLDQKNLQRHLQFVDILPSILHHRKLPLLIVGADEDDRPALTLEEAPAMLRFIFRREHGVEASLDASVDQCLNFIRTRLQSSSNLTSLDRCVRVLSAVNRTWSNRTPSEASIVDAYLEAVVSDMDDLDLSKWPEIAEWRITNQKLLPAMRSRLMVWQQWHKEEKYHIESPGAAAIQALASHLRLPLDPVAMYYSPLRYGSAHCIPVRYADAHIVLSQT